MFECVQICTVSDTLPALQHTTPGRSGRRGRSLVSSANRCSVPSVRACVSCPAWSVLASGTACAAACDVQAVRVRWGLGSPPAGYTGIAGGGVGHARDKIFQGKRRFRGSPCQYQPRFHKSEPIRLCKSPKIPKNTKRPISEPRLCYNQLKAIRQRKEELK